MLLRLLHVWCSPFGVERSFCRRGCEPLAFDLHGSVAGRVGDAGDAAVRLDIRAIIHRAVEQIGTDVGAVQAGVTPDDIALLTHIYVVASAGVVESWLLGEIDRTPEQLVAFADQMLQDHIRGARLRWSQQLKEQP